MKRILFSIIILFLFSGIALGYELGAGNGTGYPSAIDTDESVEVDYPDPLATTARAAVPNDTNAAVIAIETELGINPSGAYDTLKARLDAGDDLYYLKTEIDSLSKVETIYTKDIIDSDELAALKFIDLADTPAAYNNGKYAKSTADGLIWDDPAGISTFIGMTDTPANYTGGSLKFVRVNEGETALEFATLDLSLYYLKTEINTQTLMETIWGVSLVNDGDLDLYYLKTDINTQAKVETIWGVSLANDNELHTQNTDTDLDATFELTFVKKADNVNVLNDITSTGANIEDAVTKKHTQNTDIIFVFTNALASDLTWSGDIDTQPVGESVTFGALLYFDWTDKEWKLADADLAANMPGLRIALESKTDGQNCKMLVMGYIREDIWDFTGAIIYAGTSAGGVTSTAPSGEGQQVQRVGVAKSANILFFNPSIDVGEI